MKLSVVRNSLDILGRVGDLEVKIDALDNKFDRKFGTLENKISSMSWMFLLSQIPVFVL